MNKNKKMLYVLSAALGISTIASGVVCAQYMYSEPSYVRNTGYNPKKDGSLFPGGPCKSCTKDGSLFPGPCKKCAERKVEQQVVVQTPPVVAYTPVVYEAMQRNCCMMAPIALAHVDFRIKNDGAEAPYSGKVGNYRFRIFGCRRYDKQATLNKGRIMEKDIAFNQVFEESVNSCYKVLPMPQDLCLQQYTQELPEYVLTAEITDYFMNICDEYDWDKAEKNNARTGTSEITVTWRLMDLSMRNVYWKGETEGFGEVSEGEKNGEVKLIERAFADAASNLRNLTDFENQLMKRVSPQDLAMQRAAVIEEEVALNPAKCGFRLEYEQAKSCEISRPGFDFTQPCCCQQCIQQTGGVASQGCVAPVPVTPIIESGDVVSSFDIIENCIDENGNVKADGQCTVVDDTWVDTGDVIALDEFCVVEADPCKELTPETMYRLRSSVVEIDSPNGRKGAGLLISENYILTSGDLVDHNNNSYKIKTVRGDELNARAVRINPSKNTALLMLEKSTNYTPLALNMSLPEVGRNGFMTLGVLDVDNFKNGSDYLENSARIEGYRYTPEKGSEILANTFIQNVTVGGALFYKDCTISGMAHSGVKTNDGLDVYVPTETALRSLGISICGHEYVEESPWQQTVYKPVTEQIKQVQKAPEVMKPKDRK